MDLFANQRCESRLRVVPPSLRPFPHPRTLDESVGQAGRTTSRMRGIRTVRQVAESLLPSVQRVNSAADPRGPWRYNSRQQASGMSASASPARQ